MISTRVVRCLAVGAVGSAATLLPIVSSCSSQTDLPPAQPDGGVGCVGFCPDVGVVDVPACDDALLSCLVVVELTKKCSGPSEPNCHGGNNPADFFLHFDPETNLKQLVDVPSTERPDWFRVNPFHPEISWMLAKLRNDKDSGVEAAMPKGTDGDPEFAALVERWILAGAPTSLDAGADVENDGETDGEIDADDAAGESESEPDAGG